MIHFRIMANSWELPYFIKAPDLETAMISFIAKYPDLRIFSVESWSGYNHINSQWKKVFEDESQTP